MVFYAKPRMTPDIDIVLAIGLKDIEALLSALSSLFYFDTDFAREAIAQERLFNLMHLETALKIEMYHISANGPWLSRSKTFSRNSFRE